MRRKQEIKIKLCKSVRFEIKIQEIKREKEKEKKKKKKQTN